MAEGKAKVIFYADWIDKFEELEDDEAGRLVKHFVRYINDLNPEAPDRLTKLMFLDIKSTLKRDLGKWKEKAPQRSEKARVAGLASAEARRLKKELNSTTELKNELNPTKSTVIVSVSDSVSVNDNVKVIKDINSRKQEFYNSLLPYLKTYDKVLLKEFYEYWTEHGELDRKFRKEKEKSFSTELRLKTWFKRSKQFKEKSFEKKEKVKLKQSAAEIILAVKNGTYET